MSDFNITYFEACELLNRSKKSISRYIRRGLLHPEQIKSQQGTLEYRFSKDDIEAFKARETLTAEQTRQDGTDEPEQTGHIHIIEEGRQDTLKRENQLNKEILTETRQDTPDQTSQDKPRETGHFTGQTGQDNEVISLLKETTGFLRDQLKVKDEQIKDLGGKIDQLIERDRETNFILKSLQDKVFVLEQPKTPEPITADTSLKDIADKPEETAQEATTEPTEGRQDTQGETRQDAPEPADQTGQDEPIKAIITDDNRQPEPEPAKDSFWKRLFSEEL